jgi:hypothetical protein
MNLKIPRDKIFKNMKTLRYHQPKNTKLKNRDNISMERGEEDLIKVSFSKALLPTIQRIFYSLEKFLILISLKRQKVRSSSRKTKY